MTALIRDFRVGDEAAFAALNLHWIEEYFGVEESDRRQLENPVSSLLEPGGAIVLAELDGRVVGCGALAVPHEATTDGRTWLEVVKMATDPSAQGAGLGAAILDRLIEKARNRGADALWLETNSRLEAATRLYRRKGFRALEPHELRHTPYARCNLQMVREL
jgi:putative acetyltransferase